MTQLPCELLDEYLAGALAGTDRVRFVDHLPGCGDCRRAVRESEQLATLLTEAVARLEPIPAGLNDRIERRLGISRRRRLAVAAAAMAAMVAAVWLLGRPTPRPEEPLPVATGRSDPDTPRRSEQVRVTFPAGDRHFAVPIPTASPNVTVLRVYTNVLAAPPPAALEPPADRERNDR